MLLVSHDRAFLNNVVTSTIVFEDGGVREYVGGYDDWLRQRANRLATKTPTRRVSERTSTRRPATQSAEGAETPPHLQGATGARIAARHDRTAAKPRSTRSHREMAEPQFYQQPGPQIAAEQARLKQLEGQLAAAYRAVGRVGTTGAS